MSGFSAARARVSSSVLGSRSGPWVPRAGSAPGRSHARRTRASWRGRPWRSRRRPWHARRASACATSVRATSPTSKRSRVASSCRVRRSSLLRARSSTTWSREGCGVGVDGVQDHLLLQREQPCALRADQDSPHGSPKPGSRRRHRGSAAGSGRRDWWCGSGSVTPSTLASASTSSMPLSRDRLGR